MKYFGCVHIDIDTDLEAEDCGKDWDGICARIPGGFSVRIRKSDDPLHTLLSHELGHVVAHIVNLPGHKPNAHELEGEKEAWDLAEEMLKARIEALKCVPKEKL